MVVDLANIGLACMAMAVGGMLRYGIVWDSMYEWRGIDGVGVFNSEYIVYSIRCSIVVIIVVV